MTKEEYKVQVKLQENLKKYEELEKEKGSLKDLEELLTNSDNVRITIGICQKTMNVCFDNSYDKNVKDVLFSLIKWKYSEIEAQQEAL